MKPIQTKRTSHRILPDARRVLAKPFLLGDEVLLPGQSRVDLLMARILAIPEAKVSALLDQVLAQFESRHHGFKRILEQQFAHVANHVPNGAVVSTERRLLIGAYFTHEYSVESAALFNPSIVPAPDQSGVAAGSVRFIMSLRAVGEGHLSSIEFRSGIIDGQGDLTFDPVGPYLVGGTRTSPTHFVKRHFTAKLHELGADNDVSAIVLGKLADKFTREELEAAIASLEHDGPPHAIRFETINIAHALASSNYVATFPAESELSERVIFPAGPHETRGMEDARFVRFVGPDGHATYYATYTAYDGFQILPQLIETDDFIRFRIMTLNGGAAQNKGMALFPRQIGGKYVMLSRKDRENLHLSTSHDVHRWDEVAELSRPTYPWELLQIGNCGSPIETDKGWLVLTHGVGPMRRYAIGALLLDLDDPHRVVGYLPEPLLEPNAEEREGYVPNVLYTCGAIVHAGKLVMPYGFSDGGVAVAQFALNDVLETLLAHPPA